MSEDLKCKKMLEECQTENCSHHQLSENSRLKQESQSTHKIFSLLTSTTEMKCCFASRQFLRGDLS